MTQAAEILQRIVNRENFDSEYTVAADPNAYSIMRVDALKIFNELTPEEKIKFSDQGDSGWRFLNIWERVWYFVPLFSKWVCVSTDNIYNQNLSWNPDFVMYTFKDEEYVIDVENLKIFKEIK